MKSELKYNIVLTVQQLVCPSTVSEDMMLSLKWRYDNCTNKSCLIPIHDFSSKVGVTMLFSVEQSAKQKKKHNCTIFVRLHCAKKKKQQVAQLQFCIDDVIWPLKRHECTKSLMLPNTCLPAFMASAKLVISCVSWPDAVLTLQQMQTICEEPYLKKVDELDTMRQQFNMIQQDLDHSVKQNKKLQDEIEQWKQKDQEMIQVISAKDALINEHAESVATLKKQLDNKLQEVQLLEQSLAYFKCKEKKNSFTNTNNTTTALPSVQVDPMMHVKHGITWLKEQGLYHYVNQQYLANWEERTTFETSLDTKIVEPLLILIKRGYVYPSHWLFWNNDGHVWHMLEDMLKECDASKEEAYSSLKGYIERVNRSIARLIDIRKSITTSPANKPEREEDVKLRCVLLYALNNQQLHTIVHFLFVTCNKFTSQYYPNAQALAKNSTMKQELLQHLKILSSAPVKVSTLVVN